MDEQNHMLQLDGVRAIAILAVMWSHWLPARYQFGIPFGSGVQLFFVLSGFLITGILVRNRDGAEPLRIWRQFYARRFLRIFPLFYVVILLSLLIGIPPMRDNWIWHATYMSNFLYVWGGGDAFNDPFGHFWSLAVEEQFYLIWPFVALIAMPVRFHLILWGLIVVTPVLRGVMVYFVRDPDVVRFVSWSSFDSLAVGSLLAFLAHHSLQRGKDEARCFARPEAVSWCFLIVGAVICVGGMVFEKIVTKSFLVHSFAHTGLILCFGWFVFFASRGFGGFVGRFLSCAPLVYVGRISYGLYVFHNIAPEFCKQILIQTGTADLGGRHMLLSVIGNALITFCLAIPSWHFFEKPINDCKRYFPYRQQSNSGEA